MYLKEFSAIDLIRKDEIVFRLPIYAEESIVEFILRSQVHIKLCIGKKLRMKRIVRENFGKP